jgi:peptide/nickel transport system substrate-binding protein
VLGCGGPYENSYGAEIVIPSNTEKARQLLKGAKYDGTPVVIMHPTDIFLNSTHPVVIAAALRKAGFTVDLQAMDWQTLVSRRPNQKSPAEGGWNIFASFGSLGGSMDPLVSNQVRANGQKAWFGWPDVPEIEQLRYKFARTADPAELKKLAAEIQKLVIDEGVICPLGQFFTPTAYSAKLTGILESTSPFFWNIRKSR